MNGPALGFRDFFTHIQGFLIFDLNLFIGKPADLDECFNQPQKIVGDCGKRGLNNQSTFSASPSLSLKKVILEVVKHFFDAPAYLVEIDNSTGSNFAVR